MQCPLCEEECESGTEEYCDVHSRAWKSVRAAYGLWKIAYGHLDICDFLDRISALPSTGSKSKEIAGFVRKNMSRWK